MKYMKKPQSVEAYLIHTEGELFESARALVAWIENTTKMELRAEDLVVRIDFRRKTIMVDHPNCGLMCTLGSFVIWDPADMRFHCMSADDFKAAFEEATQ